MNICANIFCFFFFSVFFLFFFNFEPHPAVLRSYLWLCTKRAFLMFLWGPYVVLGLNPAGPHARQHPALCINSLVPCKSISKYIRNKEKKNTLKRRSIYLKNACILLLFILKFGVLPIILRRPYNARFKMGPEE